LAFVVGEIVARVRADRTQFTRDMGAVRRQGTQATNDVSRGFKGVGTSIALLKPLIASAFTAAIVQGARKAVREFALLEGALAKFDVVFATQSEEMRAWVDTFRERIPLARREIIQAAASMQDLLIPMGIAREEGTKMTKEWLELAGALAAFNDVPVDQALEAISSGIAGQSRPLRAFGIDARESAIQQTALSMGLIKAGEEMTEQVRQQALLRRAYDQSADAIDGYADQLGTTLIMEQELGATFKDTQAIIGQELQPAYNELLKTLTALLRLTKENATETTALIAGWLRLALLVPRTWGGWITGAIKASQVTEDIRKEVEKLVNVAKFDPQTFDFTAAGQAMVGIQGQMETLERLSRAMGVDPNTLDGYAEMQTQMRIISSLFEEAQKHSRSMADGAEDFVDEMQRLSVNDLKAQVKELEESIGKSFDQKEIAEYSKQIEILESRIAGLMGQLKPDVPPDEVFENMNQAIKDFDKSMEELIGKTDGNVFEKFFPPGSIGAIRQEIAELNETLEITTDPERIEALRERIRELQEQIRGTKQATEDLSEAALFFTRTFADGLENILFQARSVEDAIKGIRRQFASRALITGLGALFTGGASIADKGFFGTMFSGFRQSGGGVNPGNAYMVGESGPELFLPNSGGSIISNNQMNGGSQINASMMQSAFETALSKHVRGVSSRTLFEITEKGRVR
jgi:predicted  nucleic acid-binding Zn-ribbon protein